MIRRDFPSQLHFILGITILLLGGMTLQIAAELSQRGYLFQSLRWTALFLASLLALAIPVLLLIASRTEWWQRLVDWFDQLLDFLHRLGLLNLVLFSLVIAAYSFLVLGPPGRYLKDFLPRLGLFWLACLTGAVLIKAFAPRLAWIAALASAWMLAGTGYRLLAFIPEISAYPFTLSWSEASRYYYASLFLSRQIYGETVPPSPLHPSRYILQAVPFILPDLSIWVHRAWQVVLWLATAFGLSIVLYRRLVRRIPPDRALELQAKLTDRDLVSILYISLAFLFLFQGPVYYHLLLIPIILVWGFDRGRPWRTMALVLLASAWAGISRVNWYPVPGMLAALLFVLEEEFDPSSSPTRFRAGLSYLLWPAVWIALGTLVAFLAQAVYILWSGVEQGAFISSFTSDLLWYRLLPNPTFPLGILPAALLVSAPFFILLERELRGLPLLRLVGLAGLLGVLFMGGVIVSAKIGGGSNLHNLDAYLVLLLVAGSYALFRRIQNRGSGVISGRLPSIPALGALSILPVLLAISGGGYQPMADKELVSSALSEIKDMVEQVSAQGQEVLFISERQLLTFGDVSGVALVDPYEKVFLMEMAMAGNREYLGSYYDDLSQRRFALIVTDPMKDDLKGKKYSFGEENDAWVRNVVRPTLENYQTRKLYKDLSIEVLEPKP